MESLPRAADEAKGHPRSAEAGAAGGGCGRHWADSDAVPRTQTQSVVRGLMTSAILAEVVGHSSGCRGEGRGGNVWQVQEGLDLDRAEFYRQCRRL